MAPAPDDGPEFRRTVGGPGTVSLGAPVAVTLTSSWWVTVRTDDGEPAHLSAHHAADLIGVLQDALAERRRRNPGQR